MVGLIRLSPGDVFANDFEIARVVGEGGMGTVYAVRDRVDGEVRALKVLLPELVADEKSRRRFNQESRVASQIDSPHVPQVYRTGIDPLSGIPFISMELLIGRTLRDFVRDRGPVPMEDARLIFEQVAHALAAAHRINLVHRDLKPENVFLQESGSGPPEVKLLDFGVAKLIDLHRTSGLGTGAVGSPLWMAPEQTSAGGRISPATDIWAFGLLTFYVLTGQFYWKAAKGETGVAGLLREIHVDPIMPPSRRARSLGGPHVELPAAYDDWFNRALRRDGEERFQDGAAAMEALGPALGPRRPVVHSAAAYASTLAFDSPIGPDGKPLPSPQATQPFGGAAPLTPPPMEEEEDDDGAAETYRYLPSVEVPETQRSLQPVVARRQDVPASKPLHPQIHTTPGVEPEQRTPAPQAKTPAPEHLTPAPRFIPAAPATPAPVVIAPAPQRGLSPFVFVVLLLTGGCVVSTVAAAVIWLVLGVISR